MAFSLGGFAASGCGCCGPPGTTTSGCHQNCSCVGIPDKIQASDSLLGLTFDMDWNSSTGLWEKDYSYNYGGGGPCSGATVTLHYQMSPAVPNCLFSLSYAVDLTGGNNCPDDTPPSGFSGTCDIQVSITTTSCAPFAQSVTFGTGTTGFLHCNRIYPPPSTITWASDAPYTNTDCCVVDFALGCTHQAYSGVTVNYYTDSSKTTLISSGTNTTGGAVLNNTHATGTYYREIASTSGRFAVDGRNVTVSTCPQQQNQQLIAGTGYACMSSCPEPILTTLTAYHPIFGPINYTYSAGHWIATVSYHFAAYGGCPAKIVTVTCDWNGGSGYTETWKVLGNCPDPTGADHTATWTLNSTTCFDPVYSMSFLIEFVFNPVATADQNMYFGSSQLLDITE